MPLKITLSPSPHKNKIYIVIEEELWKEISQKIFGKNILLPSVNSLIEWEHFYQKLEYEKSIAYLSHLILKRSYHSEEIKKHLLENNISLSTIALLLEKSFQWGWLNDTLWLENFLARHQKLSFQAICFKLYQKGISKESIASLEDKYSSAQVNNTAIVHLLQTRYRSKNLKDKTQKQKIFGALLRRGFSSEAIYNTFSMLGH